MKIKFQENEFWYGTCVKYGMKMPIGSDTEIELDLTSNPTPNQAMPLLISTKGRSIWSDQGFPVRVGDGAIEVPDSCLLEETGGSLREAYLGVMKEHFPFRGMPAENLFGKIIYNTWIELTYNQNEEDILAYARRILESGMPSGVLMIDDGWAENYGDWRFHSGKFPHPEQLLKTLHEIGYEVMVWICPFISPDSLKYREAKEEGILVLTSEGETYLAKWWNGYSAVLDFSNPKAVQWLKRQLDALLDMGVNGFKFDAGDSMYYRNDNVTFGNVTPNEQSRMWAEFGEQYPYNEYRAAFRAGGYALLQRLCDKDHSWGENGIASLIPDTLLQGITGHTFGCPDMIGGGEYLNFQNMEKSGLDEELFVRHCEIACLMPAMQFSAAPYRILTGENFACILKSIEVRKKFLPYIMEELKKASVTGEPLIRYLAYEFPEENVENVTDQFMLGGKYLVAPVYEKGKTGRTLYLPKGKWYARKRVWMSQGETIYCESERGIPIIFERMGKFSGGKE
nr:glycoside hydrolase family 31 protein [uncultured Sellimonas sp.]